MQKMTDKNVIIGEGIAGLTGAVEVVKMLRVKW